MEPEMEDDSSCIGKPTSLDPLDDWRSVYHSDSDSDSDWVDNGHFRNLRHRLNATPPLPRQQNEEIEEEDVKIVYEEITIDWFIIYSVYFNISCIFCKWTFVIISINWSGNSSKFEKEEQHWIASKLLHGGVKFGVVLGRQRRCHGEGKGDWRLLTAPRIVRDGVKDAPTRRNRSKGCLPIKNVIKSLNYKVKFQYLRLARWCGGRWKPIPVCGPSRSSTSWTATNPSICSIPRSGRNPGAVQSISSGGNAGNWVSSDRLDSWPGRFLRWDRESSIGRPVQSRVPIENRCKFRPQVRSSHGKLTVQSCKSGLQFGLENLGLFWRAASGRRSHVERDSPSACMF